MSPQSPVVTIVVPTFNERECVEPLVDRVGAVLGLSPVEILFVDDSTDDTPEVIREVAGRAALPVRLLHRVGPERTGGLGGAVLAGLRNTEAHWAVVMDGDLQHPPETLPGLMERAVSTGSDVVVASRYTAGGSAGGLAGAWRRWVSSLAGVLALLLFPGRLRGCTDPMSGFFLVRRGAVDLDGLNPDGFKILLEILCRGRRLTLAEVPFSFGERAGGESKAGLRQGLVYLRHLVRLRAAGTAAPLTGFLAVGATGVLPNLVTVAGLDALGVPYLVSTAIATVVAATSNFLLTDLLLFRHRRTGRMRHRWLAYLALSAGDIAIRVPVVAGLVEILGVPLLAATVVSIVVAGVLRFAVLRRWFYPADGVAARRPLVPRRRRPPAVAVHQAPSHLVLAEAMRSAL